MKKQKIQGQITIFLALTFTLIISMILTVVETARYAAMEMRAECAIQTALNSVFAEYNRALLERYDLFFIDASYQSQLPSYHNVETRLEEYLSYNVQPQKELTFLFADDWMDLSVEGVVIENASLATDNFGYVLKKQAVNYMRDRVNINFIEEIESWITTTQTYQISGEDFQKQQEEEFNNLEEWEKENALLGEEWSATKIFPELNVTKFYVESLEVQLMTDAAWNLSDKSINPLNCVSYRIRNDGSGEEEWLYGNIYVDEIYFNEYLIEKFGNFTEIREGGELDYQIEYMIYGFPSDSENITWMSRSLLMFRSAANMISLSMDSEKKDLIRPFAEAIGALIEVPPEILMIIVMGMWSSAEGLLDVRDLMNGKRIPLIKESDDWKISLGQIAETGMELISTSETEESVEECGLSYEDYLRISLWMANPFLVVYRCMDMMEADIRLTEGNEFFRMDGCISFLSAEFNIRSSYGYHYVEKRKYSYI